MLVDVLNPAIDALTPTVDNIAPTLAIMGGIAQYSPKGFDPLDVARDFLGPIMFSIDNDPLWQSAMLVGMVGATVYQIRTLNLIVGDRSLKAVTVVSTSRLLSLGTQETKAETGRRSRTRSQSRPKTTRFRCAAPLSFLLLCGALACLGAGYTTSPPPTSPFPASHSRVESGKCGLRRRMESCSWKTSRR